MHLLEIIAAKKRLKYKILIKKFETLQNKWNKTTTYDRFYEYAEKLHDDRVNKN